MAAFSLLTIDHYFAANFPESLWEGSFCDIGAFFNCDSSAFSSIAAVAGVPLGYFGVFVGGLVMLGAVFPSERFERTNKTIALANAVGVVVLAAYSVFGLGTLCLLCTGFYVFALISLGLFWRYGIDRGNGPWWNRYLRPSATHAVAFTVVMAFGAWGMRLYHEAKVEAQSGGVAARVVEEYFSLPTVPPPSFLSPFWVVRSAEEFADAPIRVIEYGDLLCSDCLYMKRQLDRLAEEFAGQLNVVFQFFPLEAACNDVVEKDLHPGACEISYMAAYDPGQFPAIYDEVFENFQAAKTPEWREDMAARFGVEAAVSDSTTRALVRRMIQTGTEYEQTSDRHSHGIRSTPTLIINGRMVIGTFPYEQLRAIFQALLTRETDERRGDRRFMENWVEP
jgi:uncharacterized membrane protein/predicted DsbA family dithiol-disulfide isomerase